MTDNSPEYSRDKAAPAGSTFHYALLFEPAASRDKLLPALALYRELLDTLTASMDPGVTRIKLQWWLEELRRLDDQQPRHPVTTALLPAMQNLAIPMREILPLWKFLDRIASDPGQPAAEQWHEEARIALGSYWSVAGRLAGIPPSDSLDAVARTGAAMGCLDLLQHLPLLKARGSQYLPVAAHESSATDLKVLESLVCELRTNLQNSYSLLTAPTIPTCFRVLNRLSEALAAELDIADGDLIRHSVSLTPLRRFWIACRTHYFG